MGASGADTSHGVFRLRPGQERWEPRNGDLTDSYITAIASANGRTFAGTWEGRIYRSHDRGQTWEQVYGSPVGGEEVAAAR
jgi:hypothetical protein